MKTKTSRKPKSKIELAEIKILKSEVRLAAAQLELTQAIKESTVQCLRCGFEMEVGKITAIEEMWYTSPHGCTGGDYWNSGKDRWVPCLNQECKVVNRFYNEDRCGHILKVLQPEFVKKYVTVHGKDERLHVLGTNKWVQ